LSVVLDASMAVCWLFEEEWTDPALAVAQLVATNGATVPTLWRIEVANVLRTAVRHGRCDEPFADRSLRRFSALRLHVDPQTETRAWNETLALARAENLTLYDAAYLELAVRIGQPLATCDKALIAAGLRRGVEVMAS
jgi:predicted nucleic acid-binding protein